MQRVEGAMNESQAVQRGLNAFWPRRMTRGRNGFGSRGRNGFGCGLGLEKIAHRNIEWAVLVGAAVSGLSQRRCGPHKYR